jgi:hypothetical protein
MAVLIANNAKSTLAAPIGALDTSLTIAAGTSTLFPVPTGGDYFYVTLEDSTKTIREIVKVTAVAGSTFTIVRAQDGTYANIFALGSTVELRINRASLTDSVGAAASSAAAAAASASSASTSAGTATTQAGISTAQAVISTTQAGIATTQATNASNSATAANNSAIAAAASAASGMYSAVQDKSANYTVVAGDAGDLLRITTTSGPITITLPVISTVGDGFKIAVVKWTADGNPVNINRSGSDTINGGITSQIGSQFSQVVLIADLETSQWFASQSGLGATNVNVDVFSGNNSTVAFTLSADPSTKNNTYVSISGVYQAKSTYSVSGTTLTFSTAPPSGTSNIEVVYGTPLAIGTPSDGTVSTVKLADSAVTTAKIVDGAVTTAKLSTDLQAATYGMKNRIINGAMMIDQRNAGASKTLTAGVQAYVLDRFYVATNGGAGIVQQVAGTGGFTKAMRITGAAGVTDGYFGQKIESYNIADAASSTVTYKIRASSSVLTSLTWYARFPTAQDNYAGVTLITSGSITINSTPTDYTFQIALPSGVTNGLEVYFTFGAFTSGTLDITGVQLEKGSTATSFDYRPYGTELALCQRYYEKSYNDGVAVASATLVGRLGADGNSAGRWYPSVGFRVSKRSSPTMVAYSDATGASGNITVNGSNTAYTFGSNIGMNGGLGTLVSSTSNAIYACQWTAESEL